MTDIQNPPMTRELITIEPQAKYRDPDMSPFE